EARALRQQHPRWGAGFIRVVLGEHHPGAPLPAVQTVRRWLALAGLAPARPGRPPTAYRRADQVHAAWQGDAADPMPLADGRLVSGLRLVEECSGAVLQTAVFSLRLQPGRGRGRAGLPAGRLRLLGPAGGAAPGRGPALGAVLRPAAGAGAVAGGPGGRAGPDPGGAQA